MKSWDWFFGRLRPSKWATHHRTRRLREKVTHNYSKQAGTKENENERKGHHRNTWQSEIHLVRLPLPTRDKNG